LVEGRVNQAGNLSFPLVYDKKDLDQDDPSKDVNSLNHQTQVGRIITHTLTLEKPSMILGDFVKGIWKKIISEKNETLAVSLVSSDKIGLRLGGENGWGFKLMGLNQTWETKR
jgi:hypothetical protein